MTDLISESVDLAIVGGGTAGIIAAKTAGTLGAHVVLVERDRTGGDCLWTGCVPSKTLIAVAARIHAARRAAEFATDPVTIEVDFATVMAAVRRAIERVEPADSPDALRRAGAEVITGDAVFTGPREIRVGERRLRFRYALVATGSAPRLPPVPGLAEVKPLTSDTVWDITEPPRRLVVLGGGPIGCEFGQAFARLGSEVTIVEAVDRLIPREEPRAAAVLAARLAAEGVRVLTDTTPVRATGIPGSVELHVTGPDGRAVLCCDQVLVATGRHPRTGGLGLDAAGVVVDERGAVAVDTRLRTSNPRVYAAGDVTGAPAFTHVAGIHGSIAATNALLGPFRRVDHDRMPRVTFTDPEIAHVGLTADQARQRHGEQVRVRVLPHAEVDRAITEDDSDGFTQVVLGRGNRVLGVTIVAPRAGEMLAEPAAVVARAGRLREVSSVVHAYPTWADGVWNAAVAEVYAALASPGRQRAIRLLTALRRLSSRS